MPFSTIELNARQQRSLQCRRELSFVFVNNMLAMTHQSWKNFPFIKKGEKEVHYNDVAPPLKLWSVSCLDFYIIIWHQTERKESKKILAVDLCICVCVKKRKTGGAIIHKRLLIYCLAIPYCVRKRMSKKLIITTFLEYIFFAVARI